MEKLLTIGIPVYNMEKYLARCLNSVTSIKNCMRCEILVVNDGSTDNSLNIARDFERQHPETVRVIDKPNGGWGSAINRSIEEARGKYYKSLDSDDWFVSEHLDGFIHELESIEADMILAPYNEVDEDGNITAERYFSPEFYGQTLDLNEYIGGLGTFRKTIHAVAYRTDLLKTHNFSVWEKFYGDIDYINTPLKYVRTIYFSPFRLYQYMLGRAGQSVSVAGYRKHINDYLSVARKLIKACGVKTPTTPVENYLLEDSISIATFAYKLLMSPKLCGSEKGSHAQLEAFDRFLKTEAPIVYKGVAKKSIRHGVSPISLWRISRLNIYKILG